MLAWNLAVTLQDGRLLLAPASMECLVNRMQYLRGYNDRSVDALPKIFLFQRSYAVAKVIG